MPIVRFARSQQRTLLVAAVALVATGAFGAGVWLGTQPLPGSGSAREALAAEQRPIALVGSSRGTTATEAIEVIPAGRIRFGAGVTMAGGSPAASDVPPTPGPADPQEPGPTPSPDPVPTPTPVPIPTDPVVDAVEDALDGIIGSIPVPVAVPTAAPAVTETVTAVTAPAATAGTLLP